MHNRRAASAIAVMATLATGVHPAYPGAGHQDDTRAAVFETRTVVRSLDGCTPEAPAPAPAPPCTYARFRYPVVDGLADEVRELIDASIQQRLRADFFDGVAVESLAALGDALLAEYAAFRQELPGLEVAWALDRTVEVIYADDAVLSLRLDEYSYLGGAHPNSARSQWVVDRASGRSLDLDDLLIEGYEAELTRLGEFAFRAAHGLTAGDSLAEMFWFDDDRFALNDNWTIVDSGIAFRFDPYEVASYALGPTDFVITRFDLAPLARPGGPLAMR